jgi:UDP-glucuronate decarboxylase
MNSVLVMGGAGFIGSNLSKVLLDNNYKVYCLDNLSTGSTGNILKFIKNPNFTFIEHDVKEKFTLNCDWIINLASPASPQRYQLNPVGTLITNFQGTLNGLELARSIGARFIQASTSEIYGDPEIHPQPESYWGNVNPIGIRSCYDEGKRAAETLCSDFHRQYDVKSTIIRIFNTYGPGMARDDGRVVSNFIVQALEGKNITIYGKGLQSRSLCYVADLVNAFLLVLKKQDNIKGPINIGNPQEITMIDLANKIIKLTKSKSKIVYENLPQDDPKRRQPDIAYANKALGWQPQIELETGLKSTIDYFQGAYK